MKTSNPYFKDCDVRITTIFKRKKKTLIQFCHESISGQLSAHIFSRTVKFMYSEKATKFCEIFTLLLTGTTYDKSKVKISQNFVAFSEYMNFIIWNLIPLSP